MVDFGSCRRATTSCMVGGNDWHSCDSRSCDWAGLLVYVDQKDTLEARKTELEIHEKESRLQEVAGTLPVGIRETIQPVVQGQIGILIIVRFVILYLLMRAWDAIGTVFDFVLKGTALGIMKIAGTDTNSDPWWLVVPYIVLSKVPEIAYWVTFVVLGWSILRDSSELLGLRVPDVFKLKNGRSRRKG